MIDGTLSAATPLGTVSGPSQSSKYHESCSVPATVPSHFNSTAAVLAHANTHADPHAKKQSPQKQAGRDSSKMPQVARRAFVLAPLYDKPPNSQASSFIDLSSSSDEAVPPSVPPQQQRDVGTGATSSSEPSERSGESASHPSNFSEAPGSCSGQDSVENRSGGAVRSSCPRVGQQSFPQQSANTRTPGITASHPSHGPDSSQAPMQMESDKRRAVLDAPPQATKPGIDNMPTLPRSKEGGSSGEPPFPGASHTTSTTLKKVGNGNSGVNTTASSGSETRHEHGPLLPLGDPLLANLRRIVVHKALVGHATYVLFTDFQPPPQCPEPCPPLTRLFVGQLPFRVSPEMIAWLVRRFAQRPVYNIEHDLRIVQTVSRGPVRLPSGCVRASCREEDAEHIVESIHERLLCDAEGVWMATTPQEVEVIHSYCQQLRSVPRDRARGFPYRVVTVELAKRSHVRRLSGTQQVVTSGVEQN